MRLFVCMNPRAPIFRGISSLSEINSCSVIAPTLTSPAWLWFCHTVWNSTCIPLSFQFFFIISNLIYIFTLQLKGNSSSKLKLQNTQSLVLLSFLLHFVFIKVSCPSLWLSLLLVWNLFVFELPWVKTNWDPLQSKNSVADFISMNLIQRQWFKVVDFFQRQSLTKKYHDRAWSNVGVD